MKRKHELTESPSAQILQEMQQEELARIETKRQRLLSEKEVLQNGLNEVDAALLGCDEETSKIDVRLDDFDALTTLARQFDSELSVMKLEEAHLRERVATAKQAIDEAYKWVEENDISSQPTCTTAGELLDSSLNELKFLRAKFSSLQKQYDCCMDLLEQMAAAHPEKKLSYSRNTSLIWGSSASNSISGGASLHSSSHSQPSEIGYGSYFGC